MVSVVCNNGLNRSVREYGLTEPDKILNKAREIVVQEFEKSEEAVKDGMDISLCSLSLSKLSLSWAGANNPLWIIRKDSDQVEEIKADKQPIGKYDNLKPYTKHELKLQAGDSIYIFTDGYPDQFGGEMNKKFKSGNFKNLLLKIQDKSMEEQKNIINKAFEDWKGGCEQVDDVCVIGVRV
ncbi:MAG: SpoIIE family protein phosphatase [Brumimicrobium sp.]